MKFLSLSFVLVFALLFLANCGEDTRPPHPNRTLAEQYCASCHLFPEPDLLTRELWATEVLPKMGAYFGQYGLQGRGHYLGKDEEKAYLSPLYPLTATMDSTDWQRIQRYYLDKAPTALKNADKAPEILSMNRFKSTPVYDANAPTQPAFTTLVAYDAESATIYAGGKLGRGGQLRRFTSQHETAGAQRTLSPVSALDLSTGNLLAMGSLIPSDDPRGVLMSARADSLIGTNLLEQLARPVDLVNLDLNLDGKPETIIAEYGNMVGRLRAFNQDETGDYFPSDTLAPTPGALRLQRADLDADGHDDLLALFAQGDERIEVWYSRPGGPKRQRLLRFPPSYGSSDFQVIDFDKDGDLDIIYTNGDNFDYQPVPKAYHGVRLYLNDGAGNFVEAWFHEIDGAYGVEVADFDADGDYDLAVIAYFVPPASRYLTSFVYLEQTSKLTFSASGFLKDPGHHYLCMTSGDVDADGDVDLLLGNFSGYLPDGEGTVVRRGEQSPVYLFLENVTR